MPRRRSEEEDPTMAKRQGGRRRISRSHTWLPVIAAVLGLLTTVGLGRLVAVTLAWVAPRHPTAAAPAAAVANPRDLPARPAPSRAEETP
jgi:hypothetical protein